MSVTKDRLLAIAKQIFDKDKPAELPAEQKFAFSKQGEDTVTYDETLAVGSAVTIAEVPAINGTYALENGVSFVVNAGKLESVISDGKKLPEEKDKEDFAAQILELKESFNALKLAYEAEIKTLKEGFAKMPTNTTLENFNNSMKEVGGVIEKIAEIPFEPNGAIQQTEQAGKDFSAIGDFFKNLPKN